MLCPSRSHRYSVPSGVAAQGQGDVQEDDNVTDGEDRQVLDGGAVDFILQRALRTHNQVTDHLLGFPVEQPTACSGELQEPLTRVPYWGGHRLSPPRAVQEQVEPGCGFDWS